MTSGRVLTSSLQCATSRACPCAIRSKPTTCCACETKSPQVLLFSYYIFIFKSICWNSIKNRTKKLTTLVFLFLQNRRQRKQACRARAPSRPWTMSPRSCPWSWHAASPRLRRASLPHGARRHQSPHAETGGRLRFPPVVVSQWP